ncbi:uncharacterized protein N7515_007629 [Penicillium bovifimosum]|uniref:IQ calmodulin-binding motif protein n=1 Tax=Penicillium bovifimosum TaxID=126998 RepID=A0A9W9KVK2_9EURO|nr:uncharacterized protein N7515_007629 [Penicillium bovifimosum]KAJ5123804.1 hypothetical protein N7515_007629 [Penicillium bovifimosum]
MTGIPATSTTSSDDVMDRERAARTVQRIYRGHRTRRELQGLELTASTRWVEAFKEAQWHQLQSPKPHIAPGEDGFNQARRNWQRAVSVARRAGGDDLVSEPALSPGNRSEPNKETACGATAKMMDLQYFLEMVDLKHRHGSNLRAYHAYWRDSASKENFFFWLDFGEGKDVEIPQCPREKLEREQVRYLTREERQNYLVMVDESGHFRWAKNNEPVWTSTAHFKDSLRGIVPIGDDAPEYNGNSSMTKPKSTSDLPSSPSSPSPPSPASSSSATENIQSVLSRSRSPEPFTDEEYRAAKTMRKVMHPSPVAACKRLLGKSSKKEDTWLFVADTSFRLYIGIKRSGAFQHSSFLRGARIAAAGMIKIKHGQLRSLAPLSGHYRPSTANFRAFHHSLQQQGVDMSRVSMSKSYIMLAGVEGYTKAKRKARALHEKVNESKGKLHKLTE